MKGVVFSLLGLILLMCACGSSKTKQERGKATVQACSEWFSGYNTGKNRR